jgi:hypothetical protein
MTELDLMRFARHRDETAQMARPVRLEDPGRLRHTPRHRRRCA